MRVGLDQNPIGRQFGGEVTQGLRGLEGQNAGEADIATKPHRGHRKLTPAGVAMQHRAEGPLRHLVFEDAGAIRVRVARVDHQRQPGDARRGDVRAKAAGLCLRRAVFVEIVQPGLA